MQPSLRKEGELSPTRADDEALRASVLETTCTDPCRSQPEEMAGEKRGHGVDFTRDEAGIRRVVPRRLQSPAAPPLAISDGRGGLLAFSRPLLASGRLVRPWNISGDWQRAAR